MNDVYQGIFFMNHIRNLVFEGGGILGTSYVGVIDELSKAIDMDQIVSFAGTSAGSIIAAALACRANSDFITKIFLETDFSSFARTSLTGIAVGLPLTYGINDGSLFELWLGKIIQSLTGSADTTLGEVYQKFGTTFTCASTNLNTRRVVYFNTETHPNVKLVTAVRASMSIPILFKPVIIDNQYYIDGGTIDNFMIAKFDPKHTLGVSLVSTRDKICIDSFSTYIHAIVDSLICRSIPDTLADVIYIDCKDKSAMNFAMSKDELNELVTQGKNATIEYLGKKLKALA